MSAEQVQPLIFLFLMVGIFYFMLIRPQKRRVEEHRRLVGSVKEGDEVVTIGGIVGQVSAMTDEEMELEVSPGTRVRFLRSAIARRVTADDESVSDDRAVSSDDDGEA